MIERNALAELAETMSTPVELPPVEAKGLIVLNKIQLEAYKKSQRIIAEPAKVESDQFGRPMIGSALNVVNNCRAIAEEGKTE